MLKLLFVKLFSGTKVENQEHGLFLRFTEKGKDNFYRLLRASRHKNAADLMTQALNIYAYIIDNADTFKWVLEESGDKDAVELIHQALEHYRIYHLDVKAGRRKKFVFVWPEPIISKNIPPDD